MDNNKIKIESLSDLKKNGIIESFAEVFAKKFNLKKDDAKKLIEARLDSHINNVVSLMEQNINKDSIKNNISNVDLDEYLKNKDVIKG
jgi:hypothetical protein